MIQQVHLHLRKVHLLPTDDGGSSEQNLREKNLREQNLREKNLRVNLQEVHRGVHQEDLLVVRVRLTVRVPMTVTEVLGTVVLVILMNQKTEMTTETSEMAAAAAAAVEMVAVAAVEMTAVAATKMTIRIVQKQIRRQMMLALKII